jgi:hypothetical protein
VYFADCWAAAAAGPGYTYDRKNPYALRSREPSNRIDYIFVRGPDAHLRGEPIAARLALDEPVGGVWPSDHFAVVADIHAGKRAIGEAGSRGVGTPTAVPAGRGAPPVGSIGDSA